MLTAQQVVDRYFLDTRCMLIEIAATLDRYDRAAEAEEAVPACPPRLQRVYDGLALLADQTGSANRAERLLQLFSDMD
jgi:hypothetical protein